MCCRKTLTVPSLNQARRVVILMASCRYSTRTVPDSGPNLARRMVLVCFVGCLLAEPWSLDSGPRLKASVKLLNPIHPLGSALANLVVRCLGLARSLKNYQYGTEGQKRHPTLESVLVIVSGNSLVFSRKSITSTGFCWCCAPTLQHQ